MSNIQLISIDEPLHATLLCHARYIGWEGSGRGQGVCSVLIHVGVVLHVAALRNASL